MDRLTRRQLNRATMSRQLLLDRDARTPVDAVGHLVGLQAQNPLDPYLGLYSRLADFDPHELGRAIEARRLVRIIAMRSTLHLLTADDALTLRPLHQPVLDAELSHNREVWPHLRDVDLAPVLAFASVALEDEPRTTTQLRALLAEQFPDLHAPALASACRNHLALVQVPPRGVWGKRGQVRLTTAQKWLGRPLVDRPTIDEAVVRYLGAFGPALPADIAAWSRLTGMREAVDRLRPRLRSFRDEDGRELVDLPDASRPPADAPAPARLLPMYDNAVLSHADRRRYTPDTSVVVGPPVHGSVLHDGFLAGVWSIETAGGAAVLTVRHLGVSSAAVDEVLAEAERVARFLAPTATTHEVRAVPIE